ncbi:MAG: D-glucuronyl C5-epimerase family protein [Candidatus Heimdallarchaeaceae archaeon]
MNLPNCLINTIQKNKNRLIIYLATIFFVSLIIFLNLNEISNFYYIFYKHDTPKTIIRKDGIPIMDYGYNYNIYVGQVEQPVTIENYALKYYNQFLKGNSTALNYFFNCINWLLKNKKIFSFFNSTTSKKQDYFLWEHNFSIWGLQKPWYSAMAQGLGIQLFSYAYNLTKNDLFIELIEKLITAFYIDTINGGVRNYFYTTNGTWFPEYVRIYDSSYEPYFILNGFIIAILGCYYAFEIIDNHLLLDIFERGILTLKDIIHLYDTGSWSYYHLKDMGHSAILASLDYHLLHIKLLNELYRISNITEFHIYSEKWKTYHEPPKKNKIGIFPLHFRKVLFGLTIITFELLIAEIVYQSYNLVKRRKR